MDKKTKILLWIGFGLGTAILIGLLVLDFTRSAREWREINAEMETEETVRVADVTEPTTTVPETVETTTEPTTTTEATTEEVSEPTKSAEELAWMVINYGVNGDNRKAELGDRYEEVQKWIDENYIPPTPEYTEPETYAGVDYYPSGGGLNPSDGICYYDGHLETYYNLPMGGVIDIMYSLGYSGDYWVRSDGCKMFGDYIMVAADFNWLPRGSIVLTSLGWGMVCDTGGGGTQWLDLATTW